ncbi:50S ribosomal protein L18, chloroplastic [Linum perenne]
MAVLTVPGPATLHFRASTIFGNHLKLPSSLHMQVQNFRSSMSLVASSRKNTRTEKAKTLNRRRQNKFNGTPSKPRLSVFGSGKQLYAMLVDDQNKKTLFYGSTLQTSIRGDPPCSTIEAAERLGEELIKVCVELKVNEVSYDRNGNPARREKMQAFETAISRHGFLPDRATRARRVPVTSP